VKNHRTTVWDHAVSIEVLVFSVVTAKIGVAASVFGAVEAYRMMETFFFNLPE
jgi:hypothetical protein